MLPSIINLFIQQLITSTIISTIAIDVVATQAKHKDNMLSLRNLIEKSLLPRDFFSAITPPNLNTAAKTPPSTNILSKVLIKR